MEENKKPEHEKCYIYEYRIHILKQRVKLCHVCKYSIHTLLNLECVKKVLSTQTDTCIFEWAFSQGLGNPLQIGQGFGFAWHVPPILVY